MKSILRHPKDEPRGKHFQAPRLEGKVHTKRTKTIKKPAASDVA